MARTVSIDIRTTANLGGINATIGAVNRLQREIKSLATTAQMLNRALAPLSRARSSNTGLNAAVRSTTALTNATKQLAAAERLAAREAERANRVREQESIRQQRLLNRTDKFLMGQMEKLERDTQRARVQAEQAIVRQQQQAARAAVRAQQQIVQSIRQTQQALRGLQQQFVQAFVPMQRLMTTLTSLGRLLTGTLRSAFTAATNAARGFAQTGATLFANLQRAVQGTGNVFRTFGAQVVGSLNAASNAVRNFYNAGWSLTAAGFMIQRAGANLFQGMMGTLNTYMAYEQAMTRTAIAAAGPQGADPRAIQDLIFGLQRGEYMQDAQGRPMPIMQFSSEEMAQGLYFYASAIGQEINAATAPIVGPMVAQIMAMAAATMTSLETATKGVLNIAMEFGIDPRAAAMGDLAHQEMLMRIPAQLGYLANISTMEVPDIVETFKMVGPMAHILSDRNVPGAGLEEMMALTFFASEVGLRGGNVGRGINQALTTILDPTDKAIAAAAAAWGDEFGAATEENWRAFFFDEGGRLEGGLPGFFDKLSRLSTEESAAVIAEIFTTNASRALIGIQQAIEQAGGIQGIIDKIGGQRPEEWLGEAFVATNNTIFANMQHLKNAWFQVTAEIIRTIEGPLKTGLRFLADLFFAVADTIKENPWIGQFIVGLMTISATLLTVVGSMLAFGGALLLTMKAFSMLGGLAHPFLLFLFASIRALLILTPLFLALATAGALIAAAWQADFLGLRSSLTGFFKDFDFDRDIEPRLERIGSALRYTARAFQEFAVGILGGFGGTQVLGRWLMDVFGPILGPGFYAQLLRFRDSLNDTRVDVMAFINDISSGQALGGIRAFTSAIQGFLEFFFTGTIGAANQAALRDFLSMFGIEDWVSAIRVAKAAILQAIVDIVNGFIQLRNTLRPIFDDIGNNLDRIFTRQNLLRALAVLRAMIEGAFAGFGAVIVGTARAFELLTRALANAGRAGRWLDEWAEKLFGLQASAEGVARAVGVAIGGALGLRFIAAILPGFGLLTRLVPLLALVATGFVALGRAVVAFTAQTAILVLRLVGLTTAFVAQSVVIIATNAAVLTATAGYRALVTALTVVRGATNSFTLALGLMNVAAAITTSLVGLLTVAAAGGVAVVLGIAAAMLLAAYNAGGLSAVIDGLRNIWSGFVSIMMPAVTMIGLLVMGLAEWITNMVGASATSDNFRRIGQALAIVLLGLGAAFIGLATVALISFVVGILAALGPVLGLVAAIGLLIAAFAGLPKINVTGWIADIAGAFEQMWDALSMDGAKADERVKLMLMYLEYFFLRAKEKIFEGLFNLSRDIGEAARKYTGLTPLLEAMGLEDTYQGPITDYLGRIEGDAHMAADLLEVEIGNFEQEIKTRNLVEKLASSLNPWDEGGAEAAGQTFLEGLGDLINIDDVIAELGLEDIFAEGGKFSVTDLIEIMGFDTFTKAFEGEIARATGMGLDEVLRNEFENAQNAYEAFQKYVAEVGPSKAISDYLRSGREIPTDPGTYDAWLADQTGQLDEAEESIVDKAKEMNASIIQALTSMDMPTAMRGMFGAGSIADTLMQVGEQIISNIGDRGPWLNLTELLADAAGMGLLGTDISGQNVHAALAPALEIVAQQTGMSINEIMKGIPKYIVPQEFVPLATAELMEGLNSIGRETYEILDTLGTQFIDPRTGAAFEEFGIEWAELAAYGIGQGIAGVDWDLADFIAETWQISRDEATAYLAQAGIVDPDVINQSWFADTQMLIASMGGQVSLITEEWFTWLQQITNDGETMMIELTQEAFDRLPDYIKLGFSNMGYTFVIASQDTVDDIVASARIVRDAFVNAYGEPMEVIRTFTDEFGQKWVEFRNTAGDVVTVAAPEYAAWFQAHLDIINAANGTTDALTRWKALMETPIDMSGTTVGGQLRNIAQRWGIDTTPTEGAPTAPTMPGIPDPAQFTAGGEARGQAFAQGLAQGIVLEQTTINANFDAVFEAAATSAVTAFMTQMRSDFTTQMATPFGTGAATAPTTGPFDGTFKSYATTAMNAFVQQVVVEWTNKLTGPNNEGWVATTTTGPFDNIFRSYGTSAVAAFKEAVNAGLAGWQPSFGGGDKSGAVPLADTGPQRTITVKLTVDKTEYDKGMYAALVAGQNLAKMTFTSTIATDDTPYRTIMAAVRQDATNYVNTTYVGRLDANNTEAIRKIHDATWAAWAYDNTYTATLAVADYATWTVNNLIDRLWVLDGMVATSTVILEQRTVTSTQHLAAGGTVSTPFQWVGERGPELTAMPQGSRVYSNARSMGMLRDAVHAAMRDVIIPIKVAIDVSTKPRENRSAITHESFLHARQWDVQNGASSRGDLKVEINNLHIAKEVDIDKAVERIDRLSGRRFELARRGMTTFENARTL